MQLSRRLMLAAPLLLAACGDEDVPRTYPPIRYDYLTPLRLNVASIEFTPLPRLGPLDQVSPAPAAPALRQMAEDRLSAAGSSGRAVVTVDEARITSSGGSLDGTMGLHLDIIAADGSKAGFAEARVSRTRRGGERNLAGPLYDMTKQMLDDMNVELEYQIRLSLRDYIQTTTTAPAPAPVQQQDLRPVKPAL